MDEPRWGITVRHFKYCDNNAVMQTNPLWLTVGMCGAMNSKVVLLNLYFCARYAE